MTAIPAHERAAHEVIRRRLMASATIVRELPNGLELQWPASEYEAIARFLDYERRCCPFLTLSITISPEQGPLGLRVTGPEGVTAFLRSELHLPVA